MKDGEALKNNEFMKNGRSPIGFRVRESGRAASGLDAG